MAEWYNKTKDFTGREKEFRLLAYRNTLCKELEGKQVLCHIKTTIDELFETPDVSDAAKVAVMNLLGTILENCGIVSKMKIIEALSGVAAGYTIPETEEEDPLNA